MILASDLGQVKLADEPSLKQDELKGAEPVKEKQASIPVPIPWLIRSVHPGHPCVRSAPSLLLGNSLVAYTGAPSNRGNNDQEYLRRADLDALIKLFKENGNTFGYSFGGRAIENHKDLTRTDRMHESLIDMRQVEKRVLALMIKLWNQMINTKKLKTVS
ncbi:hypothetical protein IGI04_042199 [Brassica rapa subsp. trilocularis]|uniref:Uncharacterized protein n=1 Tax=Brassica rapa subsp. trilocularis TaxID=1813537 RepID=A0ABQ7KLU5_BRACM|nr:hypothetical protein IGI04_042199 [Brassica rapa subsp. trilocularis]